MRRIVLYPLYFIVITPLGWLMRVVHDPLRRRWDAQAMTYLTVPRTARGANGKAGR